ncbi:uncharacterized protein LOC122633750 [Vespula pensylvanica]|uniref:Centromere protein M n=1 Tax=Vespula pensylvanica TaxID=30213 RepID=A0A834NI42_VESPE|nr:uncharacterized protein LOC122633750 [Vespula pensylvanica]KAF7411000.1 hypothetical protein H0235_013607 [Vespula pensylvanica]
MNKVLHSSGVQRNDIHISFLVVGTAELREHISDGLYKSAKEREWRIEIHKCESIVQILENNISICIDFIIFAFDSRMSISLEQIKINIGLIDDHFIISGACCLVHGNGVLDVMGFAFHNLKEIRNKYKIRFLSANTSDPNSCINLGNRILNVTSTILGLESRIPTLANIP